MDTTTTVKNRSSVEDLVAAMHMGGMLSRVKQAEFRLLLRNTRTRVIDALYEASDDFDSQEGTIEVRPGAVVNRNTFFRILLNIIAVHVGVQFKYFTKQLRKTGDVNKLLDLQPEQLRKVEEAARVLHTLVVVDKKCARGSGSLVRKDHRKAIRRHAQSICHMSPRMRELLGLDDRAMAVWADKTP